MGLDMYAFRVRRDQVTNPDSLVDLETNGEQRREEIAYWRKFNALHGWMQDLYNERGGKSESFNCDTLVLTEGDLDQLESDLNEGKLKPRSGFFFGAQEICAEDVYATMGFIDKARKVLAEGDLVVYDSWW